MAAGVAVGQRQLHDAGGGWVRATCHCHFLQFGVLVLPTRRRTLVVLNWQRQGVLQSRRYVENENGDGNLSVRIVAMAEDITKFCL